MLSTDLGPAEDLRRELPVVDSNRFREVFEPAVGVADSGHHRRLARAPPADDDVELRNESTKLITDSTLNAISAWRPCR